MVEVKSQQNLTNQKNNFPGIIDLTNISSFSKVDQQKILQSFLDDTNRVISQLKKYKEEHDLKEISFLLHSMKGTSGNVGAKKLNSYVREIESAFGTGKLPDDQNWLEEIESTYNEVKETIEVILKQ